MTQRQESIVNSYNRSSDTELYHCYSSFSEKKLHAWEYCKNLCYKYNGIGLKIISHNGYVFSAGFKFEDEQGRQCLMYITKTRDEIIVLEK